MLHPPRVGVAKKGVAARWKEVEPGLRAANRGKGPPPRPATPRPAAANESREPGGRGEPRKPRPPPGVSDSSEPGGRGRAVAPPTAPGLSDSRGVAPVGVATAEVGVVTDVVGVAVGDCGTEGVAGAVTGVPEGVAGAVAVVGVAVTAGVA